MSGGGPEFVLLSFHGTLLCYGRRSGALCHRPLGGDAAEVPPLRLGPAPQGGVTALLAAADAADRDGLLAVLDGLAMGQGLFPGSLYLSRRGLYVTAEPGGGVTVFANQCMGWESFIALPAAALALLTRIMATAWTLPDGAEVSPAEISLGANFSLRFGPLEVDLRQALPVAEGARILLTPRQAGQAPVTATPAGGDAAGAAAKDGPEIWIQPLGNTANRALQYLTAEAIRAALPGAVIRNIALPEWGMDWPAEPPPQAVCAHTGGDRYRIDVNGLADCLRRGVVESVILDGYTFNLDQYPPRAVSRRLLGPTVSGGDAVGFGAAELVCSVRGGEILTGIHADYLPLPPGYYRMLAERTGLALVFFGQLGDDAYTASLRAAFPEARFIAGRDPGYDFDTLRRSRHIALSISTFAWLAAWLSEAETVILPVGGMFNPVQHPDQMYLPYDDPAYRFVLLPFAKAVNLAAEPERFARQQALLAEHARMIGAREVEAIWRRAETLGRGRVLVGGFDPDFYTARYPQAAQFVAAGQPALEHYLHHGAAAGLLPLAFDPAFYVDRYPHAALEIASGRYATPLDHYMAVGRYRTYAPTASAM